MDNFEINTTAFIFFVATIKLITCKYFQIMNITRFIESQS